MCTRALKHAGSPFGGAGGEADTTHPGRETEIATHVCTTPASAMLQAKLQARPGPALQSWVGGVVRGRRQPPNQAP